MKTYLLQSIDAPYNMKFNMEVRLNVADDKDVADLQVGILRGQLTSIKVHASTRPDNLCPIDYAFYRMYKSWAWGVKELNGFFPENFEGEASIVEVSPDIAGKVKAIIDSYLDDGFAKYIHRTI